MTKKFATNEFRVKNRSELLDILEDRMKLKTNKEWNQVMEGAKFPYGPVNRLKEVFEDPQVEHNQMMRTMPDGTFGDIKQVCA